MDRTDGTVSLLVVEDEVITLEVLFSTLARKYPLFEIYRAADGNSGLELFNTHLPDIVITDVRMPGMSGLQMIGMMQAIKSDTRFIVISGDLEREDDKSVEEGLKIDCFIDKPVVFRNLFNSLENCVTSLEHDR